MLVELLVALFTGRNTECVYPGTCDPPEAKFSRTMDMRPREMWVDDGGYCGSLSIQEVALSYGAWISQDLVRKSAADGGDSGDPVHGWEVWVYVCCAFVDEN